MVVDIVHQPLAESRQLGIGHVLVVGAVHHGRDHAQDRPRFFQVGEQDLEQPGPGVLGHVHRVLERHPHGGGAFVVQAAQPLRHPVQGGAGDRRDVEVGGEQFGAVGMGLVQHIGRGLVAGVGSRPQAGRGAQAEPVKRRSGQRLAGVGVDRDGRGLDIARRFQLERAPDVDQRRWRKQQPPPALSGRRTQGRQRAENGDAGVALGGFGGDHLLDRPHAFVPATAGRQTGLQISQRAVRRGGHQRPHATQLQFGQVGHRYSAGANTSRVGHIAESGLRLSEVCPCSDSSPQARGNSMSSCRPPWADWSSRIRPP